MSSENFMRTSLYLVRLKIFECIKLLQRRLHQIQENSANRNFKTALRVNLWLVTHATIVNLKSTTTNCTIQIPNNKFFNGILEGMLDLA